VGDPVLIALDFIARQHRSLVFEDSDDRALQQPAFCGAPETTIIRAVDQQAFPDNCTLQIGCHFAVSLLRNCTIAVVVVSQQSLRELRRYERVIILPNERSRE
jgi:hypothetical protein